jgi:hypothetical protein
MCGTRDVMPFTIANERSRSSTGLTSTLRLAIRGACSLLNRKFLSFGKPVRGVIEAICAELGLDLVHLYCRCIRAEQRGEISEKALGDEPPAVPKFKAPLKTACPSRIMFAPCTSLTPNCVGKVLRKPWVLPIVHLEPRSSCSSGRRSDDRARNRTVIIAKH